MSLTPAFLEEDAFEANPLTVNDVGSAANLHRLEEDAHKFKDAYLRHAQFVFSRVQHHVHKKTKRGYVPLKACMPKTKKRCQTCKADFPKTRFITKRSLVICRGLAKKFKLKIAGRRSAFGSILGKRRGEWQSGTTLAFAVAFGSNSHTMLGWRVPVIPETHEATACLSKICHEHISKITENKAISKLAQRAQREATGYYCGYTFKPQPVGKRHLRGAAECLNYMSTGLEDKTPGQQWHRITHRVFTDFQHRCMTRTALEECNLSANWDEHDVKKAEFVRTFQSNSFPRHQSPSRGCILSLL